MSCHIGSNRNIRTVGSFQGGPWKTTCFFLTFSQCYTCLLAQLRRCLIWSPSSQKMGHNIWPHSKPAVSNYNCARFPYVSWYFYLQNHKSVLEFKRLGCLHFHLSLSGTYITILTLLWAVVCNGRLFCEASHLPWKAISLCDFPSVFFSTKSCITFSLAEQYLCFDPLLFSRCDDWRGPDWTVFAVKWTAPPSQDVSGSLCETRTKPELNNIKVIVWKLDLDFHLDIS